MSSNIVDNYRRTYAKLLRLFPASYQERFADSMEQTFSDILCEHAAANRSLLAPALWMSSETSLSLIKEHLFSPFMKKINLLLILGVVGLLLLIPLIAMQVSDEWNWTLSDFIFAAVVLGGAGVTFELISRQGKTLAYRAAVGMAVAAGLMLLWVNAAVGIISHDHPSSLLYVGVVALAFLGALATRFQPRALAQMLLVVIAAHIAVPFIAYAIWPEAVTADLYRVIGSTAFFSMLWLGASILFRQTAERTQKIS